MGPPPQTMKPGIFTEYQTEELKGSLSSQVVKERRQGGIKLSYVEGWWVIRELNRIFGFDAWTQEIVDIKCVNERERKIGRDQKDGWGVSYVARIRINVGGVHREGVGAGHGIDVDLGLAHESAIKEAATDAMKRAAMTFGNPFGLALYDKDKTNVEDAPPSETQVSEIDKINEAFIQDLNERLETINVNKNGIRTLKKILNVSKFEDVAPRIRQKLVENLTPEYAEKLNAGLNSKGDKVIDIKPSADAPSISDLQSAAKDALNV